MKLKPPIVEIGWYIETSGDTLHILDDSCR